MDAKASCGEIDLAIKEGRVEEWNALEQYVAECIYRSHK